jgi:RNA polymerase sigma-70 factor (ECF subfamily)
VELDETRDTTPRTDPVMAAEEASLLVAIRQGCAEAGSRFVRDYYPGVYRYLLCLARHTETAEDVTQETFLQAWRHLEQFQGRAPLRVWLCRIARHEFLR